MKPGTIHSLEDAIAWIYGHEGRINVLWDEQKRFNNMTNEKTTICQTYMQGEIKELRKDIQAMRKTIYMAMGGASVLGTIIGFAVAIFVRHLVMGAP
jgi:hypothetical protein